MLDGVQLPPAIPAIEGTRPPGGVFRAFQIALAQQVGCPLERGARPPRVVHLRQQRLDRGEQIGRIIQAGGCRLAAKLRAQRQQIEPDRGQGFR
jgi:hypothetical protein